MKPETTRKRKRGSTDPHSQHETVPSPHGSTQYESALPGAQDEAVNGFVEETTQPMSDECLRNVQRSVRQEQLQANDDQSQTHAAQDSLDSQIPPTQIMEDEVGGLSQVRAEMFPETRRFLNPVTPGTVRRSGFFSSSVVRNTTPGLPKALLGKGIDTPNMLGLSQMFRASSPLNHAAADVPSDRPSPMYRCSSVPITSPTKGIDLELERLKSSPPMQAKTPSSPEVHRVSKSPRGNTPPQRDGDDPSDDEHHLSFEHRKRQKQQKQAELIRQELSAVVFPKKKAGQRVLRKSTSFVSPRELDRPVLDLRRSRVIPFPSIRSGLAETSLTKESKPLTGLRRVHPVNDSFSQVQASQEERLTSTSIAQGIETGQVNPTPLEQGKGPISSTTERISETQESQPPDSSKQNEQTPISEGQLDSNRPKVQSEVKPVADQETKLTSVLTKGVISRPLKTPRRLIDVNENRTPAGNSHPTGGVISIPETVIKSSNRYPTPQTGSKRAQRSHPSTVLTQGQLSQAPVLQTPKLVALGKFYVPESSPFSGHHQISTAESEESEESQDSDDESVAASSRARSRRSSVTMAADTETSAVSDLGNGASYRTALTNQLSRHGNEEYDDVAPAIDIDTELEAPGEHSQLAVHTISSVVVEPPDEDEMQLQEQYSRFAHLPPAPRRTFNRHIILDDEETDLAQEPVPDVATYEPVNDVNVNIAEDDDDQISGDGLPTAPSIPSQAAEALNEELASSEVHPAIRNRVFAQWRGMNNYFYPATALVSFGDEIKVRFENGSLDLRNVKLVRCLDLRIGDIVKVDKNDYRKLNFEVIGFDDKLDMPIEKTSVRSATGTTEERLFPRTDIQGHQIIQLRQHLKEGAASTAARVEELFVPLTSLYLTKSQWKFWDDRAYVHRSDYAPALGGSSFMEVLTLEMPQSSSKPKGLSATESIKLLSSPHTAQQLFTGMAFATTFVGSDVNHNDIASKVASHGGVVLSDGFGQLFEADTSPGSSQLFNLSELGAAAGFTALITDTHSRRSKHMTALALGIPILSWRWIDACLADPEAINQWSSYLLPAGECTYLSGAVKSRTLTVPSQVLAKHAQQLRLDDVTSHRSRILSGKKILFVAGKAKALQEKRQAYQTLSIILGAEKIQHVVDIDEARSIFLDAKEEWNMLYVPGDEEQAQKFLLGATTQSPKKARGKKRLPLKPTLLDQSAIKVIGDENLIQGLIFGRLV
jgi:hypothetical protein